MRQNRKVTKASYYSKAGAEQGKMNEVNNVKIYYSKINITEDNAELQYVLVEFLA